MAEPTPVFEFPAPVLRIIDSGMTWHYIPIPTDVADELEARNVRRLIATVDGIPFNRAMQRNRKGERYLIASRSLLRDVKASFGDTVLVELAIDPDPDNPDIPEELALVLADDSEASDRFYSMTPGKRRGLAHYVDSAKRPETRIRRALELAEKLRTYTLWGDRNQQ